MSVERVQAVLVDDEEAPSSKLKLGPLLVAGVAVFIVVSALARTLIPDPANFTDEEWVGTTRSDILFYFGVPGSGEDLESGGQILNYRVVVIRDEHYAVEDVTVILDASGLVTAFSRE